MNRNVPFVITISREIGSGGHTIGQILAEKLNTRYCDKELIRSLEQRFSLSWEKIEKLKGEKKHWLADFIQFISPLPTASTLGIQDSEHQSRTEVTTGDIFMAETEILRELAAEGSCVVAGRSGFFVFKDHPNHLDIFITAPKDRRIRRVMRKQGLDEASATALITDIDKARENYIERFAGTSRYDARNYDLVINAGNSDEEQIAGMILSYIGFTQQ
ncbi:MAG: cytidylate kinase-like family protein [Bacteroidales bacterium]|nr:cytidylate kinase-like family protein [Bacteroidales bacterium]